MSHTMTNLHWFAVGPKTQLRQWPMGTRPKPLAAHYIYALYVILQWQYMGASIAFPAGEWVISVRIKNSKTTMRPNIFSKPVKLASLVTLIHVIVLVNWSIVIASELCPAVKGTNLDHDHASVVITVGSIIMEFVHWPSVLVKRSLRHFYV